MDDSLLPMTDVQTRALTKSRSFLVKNLTLANITDDLVSKGVFTDAMLEEIEVKRTPTEKKQKLLTDLVRRPKDCFEKFIDVLDGNGERHCAAEIKRNEELAMKELQEKKLMFHRLRPGSGPPTFPAPSFLAPHCPPMQFQPHLRAQHVPSTSTSQSQPAKQEAKLPVQETNEGRQHSAGMSSFPSTGTSQARSSSSLPSGATNSDDDLDRSDAGRQLNNPGPQLQGASPTAEPKSKYEKKRQTKPDFVYIHETTPRGLALIINNVKFDRLEHQTGSESDCDLLHKMLMDFGMEVTIAIDLKGQGMKELIQKFAEDGKLQQVHSCVVAIMSHGSDHGKICGSDYNPKDEGTCITMDIIKDIFSRESCPHMKGKPKFFIIQACRGGKEDISRNTGRTRGVHPTEQTDAAEMEVDEECPPAASWEESELPGIVVEYSTCPAKEDTGRNAGERIGQLTTDAVRMDEDDGSQDDEEHEMADFFIAYATCKKYVAYRYLDQGSPFIKTLVGVFKEHAHNMHVADLLTMVNNQFSAKRSGGKRTIAEKEDTLRNIFYLNPPRR